jgi:hypothetical protein
MKIVLTLCVALLLGFNSKAQLPQTFNGSLNGGSAVNNWYYTPPTANPIVASSCASPKTIAGPFTNADVRYETYTISNTSSSSACVKLSLTPACTQGNTTLLLTVFKGTFTTYGRGFDLAAFSANYLGDAGVYSSGPTSCSVQVAAGQSILVVVNTNGPGSGPGSGTQSCSAYTLTASAPTPLPVDLISFKGQATATGNALEWATASEQDNLGFVVERSTDGRSFAALDRVAGGGTRSYRSAYAYLDTTPAPLSYYRLRQQDIGGSESFSPVITVQTTGALHFFPNPVLDQATFTSPTATRLVVRDGLGRICQVLPLAAGSQPVSLATLPAGVYSVTNEATHQTMRLVKAEQ